MEAPGNGLLICEVITTLLRALDGNDQIRLYALILIKSRSIHTLQFL